MQEYRAGKIVVGYDPKVCTHAGECVRGLPSVFNSKNKPWIDPSKATPEQIEAQVKKCPSGALSMRREG